MKVKSQTDFLAGLMFTSVGVAFGVGATNYTVGSAARMGPGYFPLLVACVLTLLGLAVIARSLAVGPGDGDPVGRIAWKPLLHVVGANLAFGVALGGIPALGVPAFGLILGIYALVVIASMGGAQFTLRSSLILATILAVGSYLVFVLGLSLQFQAWPSFIAG